MLFCLAIYHVYWLYSAFVEVISLLELSFHPFNWSIVYFLHWSILLLIYCVLGWYTLCVVWYPLIIVWLSVMGATLIVKILPCYTQWCTSGLRLVFYLTLRILRDIVALEFYFWGSVLILGLLLALQQFIYSLSIVLFLFVGVRWWMARRCFTLIVMCRSSCPLICSTRPVIF